MSRDIQIFLDVGALGVLPDGQLLDRFIARREGPVFEEIVRRHGPMVWGVCRRGLHDHHDAEDAFQATFLVLARKAASVVPREKVGNWLHGVAYRTAMKARATRARRRLREGRVSDVPEPEAVTTAQPDDRLDELDRELTRLPENYRIPIVLCELEGMTHKQAAERLGWPIGTVSGRISRARAMLSRRLSRGRLPLSVASLAALLARGSASASMPARLIGSTCRAASMVAAGRAATAGGVSAEVVTLMEGVSKMMLLARSRDITFVLLAALAASGVWQFKTRADEKVPPDEDVFHATVDEVINDAGLLVARVEVETLPGSWIKVVSNKPGRGGGGVRAASPGPSRPEGRARTPVTIVADHAEWKAGPANVLKFVMRFGGPSDASSTMSNTGPMSEGKGLADVVSVTFRAGDYKYGAAIKLVTFQDVTYSLIVKKP